MVEPRKILAGDVYAYRGDLYVVTEVESFPKPRVTFQGQGENERVLVRKPQTVEYSTEWDYRGRDHANL